MTGALLLSLLVKSSLVAGAGLICARFLAQRAVDRVDILRGTVCLLLALPVIMNVLPAMDLALLPATSPDLPADISPAWSNETAATALSWPPSVQLIGGLWLLGLVAVAGRLQLGLLTLHRWTRQGRPVTCAQWTAPLEHLSPADRPRLVSSDRVDSPLSWGVAPGFIVIDPGSLAERHAAPAILAHELAHLRRHDWIFLVLSRLALALFWFNPLVWRLHASLADRSEEAADAAALETVDRTLYAKALVRLAAHPAPFAAPLLAAPRAATAMAADARTLKTRIACIMTDTSANRRPLTVALTIAALAIVATPLAALGLSRQDTVTASAPLVPPAAPVAPVVPPEPVQMAEAAPAAPVPPAPPAAPPTESHSYSYFRIATPAEREMAAEARARAAEARIEAAEARRQADESRAQADEARRHADESRLHAEIARTVASEARVRADQARAEGERARMIGERARQEAARHMVKARVQMAQGAQQMRKGAQEMRAEAARLRDPAYRAKQIAENRAHGSEVTDADLRDLAGRLPSQADDMDRQADRLAAEARNPT